MFRGRPPVPRSSPRRPHLTLPSRVQAPALARKRTPAFFLKPPSTRAFFASDAHDNNHEKMLDQARELSGRGKALEAEKLYEGIINKYPSDKRAYDELVRLWIKLGPFTLKEHRLNELFYKYKKHVEPNTQHNTPPEKLYDPTAPPIHRKK